MIVCQDEEFKGLYLPDKKYLPEDLLKQWQNDALKYMNKKHNINAYNYAISIFEMLNQISQSNKFDAKIIKCKVYIEEEKNYINEQNIKEANQKQAEQEKERQEKEAQEKAYKREKTKSIIIKSIITAIICIILILIIAGITACVNKNNLYKSNHQYSDISINITSKSKSFKHNDYSTNEDAGTYYINYGIKINNNSGAIVNYIKVEITVYNLSNEEQGSITSTFGSNYYDRDQLKLDVNSSKTTQTEISEDSYNGNVSTYFAYLYNNDLTNMKFSYKIIGLEWSDGARYYAQ